MMKAKLLLSLMFIIVTDMLKAGVFYADKNASGSNNGNKWSTTYNSLHLIIEK